MTGQSRSCSIFSAVKAVFFQQDANWHGWAGPGALQVPVHVLGQGSLELVEIDAPALAAVFHPVEGVVHVAELDAEEVLEDGADPADADLAVGDAPRGVQGIDQLDKGALCIGPQDIFRISIFFSKEQAFRLFGGYPREQVVVEELVGEDAGDLIIVVGGKLRVDLEYEAVDTGMQVDLSELEEMVVPVGPPQPVVQVEVGIADVLLVFLLELVQLAREVFAVEGAAADRAGCLDAEHLVVVDQLAQDLGLDGLEELNFFVVVGKAFFQHVAFHLRKQAPEDGGHVVGLLNDLCRFEADFLLLFPDGAQGIPVDGLYHSSIFF